MKRYRMKSSLTVAYLAAGYLLAACANGETATAQDASQDQGAKSSSASGLQVESAPTIVGEPEAESKKAKENVSLGPGLRRLADLSTQDLGSKLGLEPEDIDIVQADYVTWRDSSLGCPQPGYQYMQVLTNGSRVLLRAEKLIYHYHSGGNRQPFLCKKPSAQEPLPYAPGEA